MCRRRNRKSNGVNCLDGLTVEQVKNLRSSRCRSGGYLVFSIGSHLPWTRAIWKTATERILIRILTSREKEPVSLGELELADGDSNPVRLVPFWLHASQHRSFSQT